MLKTWPVSANLIIQIIDRPAKLSPDIEKIISENWEAERSKNNGAVFNGLMLSFVGLIGDVIEARVTDYRSFLAQIRMQYLYDILKIQPLAISGLVTFESQVAFGKRASSMTQDACKWELAPSGGLTPNDKKSNGKSVLEKQFYEELEEELGLSRSMVSSVRPFLMIEDTASHVFEIGVEAALFNNRNEGEPLARRRSNEYSEICWIGEKELREFCSIEIERGGLVETSVALLKYRGLI